VVIADIHGTYFNGYYRRGGNSTATYEKVVAVDPAAEKIYSNPPYPGSQPPDCPGTKIAWPTLRWTTGYALFGTATGSVNPPTGSFNPSCRLIYGATPPTGAGYVYAYGQLRQAALITHNKITFDISALTPMPFPSFAGVEISQDGILLKTIDFGASPLGVSTVLFDSFTTPPSGSVFVVNALVNDTGGGIVPVGIDVDMRIDSV